jgi:hypothetical protein
MGAMDAHWLKHNLYNKEFGLYDCFAPMAAKEPLAVVRAFPEEDPIRETYLVDLCYRYYECKIHEFFHLSLTEYMALPMPYARKLDDIARNHIRPMEMERLKRESEEMRRQLSASPEGKK